MITNNKERIKKINPIEQKVAKIDTIPAMSALRTS